MSFLWKDTILLFPWLIIIQSYITTHVVVLWCEHCQWNVMWTFTSVVKVSLLWHITKWREMSLHQWFIWWSTFQNVEGGLMFYDLNGYSFPDYQACEKGANIVHSFEGLLCFFRWDRPNLPHHPLSVVVMDISNVLSILFCLFWTCIWNIQWR